jgi:hypothetical protein
LALQQYVQVNGQEAGIKLLAPCSRHAFARLYGGLPTHSATLILASQKLSVNLEGCIGEPEPADGDAGEVSGS